MKEQKRRRREGEKWGRRTKKRKMEAGKRQGGMGGVNGNWSQQCNFLDSIHLEPEGVGFKSYSSQLLIDVCKITQPSKALVICCEMRITLANSQLRIRGQ